MALGAFAWCEERDQGVPRGPGGPPPKGFAGDRRGVWLKGMRIMENAMSPRVSVLMLTYNRPQFIGKAIESILAQEFEDWELLVVHDGPNEEIPVIMEEWEK